MPRDAHRGASEQVVVPRTARRGVPADAPAQRRHTSPREGRARARAAFPEASRELWQDFSRDHASARYRRLRERRSRSAGVRVAAAVCVAVVALAVILALSGLLSLG